MSRPSTAFRLHVTDDLGSVAGRLIRDAIFAAQGRPGPCRVALTGGSTPGSTYAWLAKSLPAPIYPRLAITWTDDRLVPHDHEQSNVRLARETWLDRVPVQPCRVVPLTHGEGLEASVHRATASFMALMRGLDVLVLGVGPDGHIASLFPGHPALESTAAVVGIADSPKPPAERVSLTLPVLRTASTTVLVARGEEKAEMLLRVAQGDVDLPLGRLAPTGDVHWVLDHAAASKLTVE